MGGESLICSLGTYPLYILGEYRTKDGGSFQSVLTVDDQSTDTSSSSNAISGDPQFKENENDLLERPASNPFGGEKIEEDEEDGDFQNLFQGIYYCKLMSWPLPKLYL